MNYCSAAFGIIALVSLLTWLFDGRKNFTGPETSVVNAIEPEESVIPLGAQSSIHAAKDEKN